MRYITEMDIQDLGLPARVVNALRYWNNIETAEQLVATDYENLVDIPNLGRVGLGEIYDALTKHGFAIAWRGPKKKKPPALPANAPKTRRRVRKTYYWECAIDGHYHISSENAERCIAKTFARPNRVIWNDETYARLQAMRDSGVTLKQLAIAHKLSVERIRQVLAKWDRIRRHPSRCQQDNHQQ